MRYDKKVYFQKIKQGEYDPATGNYGEDEVTETLRFASVVNTGTEMMRLVYGQLRQDSLTIQIQNHYTEPFDYIRYGDKTYSVDRVSNLMTKQVFVVSEVQ